MKNKKSILAYPYIVWSAIFIVIPLILVFVFSFTIETDNGRVFSLANYKELMDPIYFKVFFRSITLAGISTIICLLVGYPVAYLISKANVNRRGTLILLFILPMWMNFLLRTYAWVAILGKNGLLNYLLGIFGIEPVSILYTNVAILLGMVYNFLPFMVLPIYTSLSKMDNDLINAARDLGANSLQVFTKVIFPLSLPGVVSGITMVFMPSVTTFAISRLLGGGKFMLIGDLIEQQFTVVGDWNFGSAVSIFMMIVILISMAVMSKVDDESDKEGGGLLF
ncbi:MULTISPECIES: ABC transporter permease [Romboutsia]|uniref:Putrescine transport system permease protein PotH n=1 Tax=Romboutsia hominis TaxID=1507512 RepID=A0A2P2BNK3_9FIRM|nr:MULTISPECIES: ABC transporter permease [Romboutsia]MCH1959372.1 ABC transporter permease [Romboutsia hominis]MCH1970271.1 ABC transporter permease [Romboutsia hominis]MDB8790558.1 ABC transporter permease [Romboutsia sp. 1001216sp1]MDB8794716.1 ABC transporter permease [Romboutsia sp. 1001216sp1]MDB8797461.1 ABC transporter permease [Romboutsia sp. 1001216sp1]